MEPTTSPVAPAPSPQGEAALARFATLVEPHLPAVRAFVERRDPTLCDEVMSEVGIVAWRRLDAVPAGHERPWLFGVARLVLLAERRKVASRRERELGDDALAAVAAPGAGGDLGLASAVAAPLSDALGTLSSRDRELLLLTAWEGLSTAEAAEVVGIRATAARMGLVRARRRLATALDTADPGWRGNPAAAEPARTPSPQEVSTCADASI